MSDSRIHRLVKMALPALAAGASACTSDVPDYTPDADTGSTHAVIVVDRTESADPTVEPTAEALAQFVSVPAYSEPDKVLEFSGTGLSLPGVGTCSPAEEATDDPATFSSLGPVEFLEAGNVSIQADGVMTVLARHAFPTVSDFASGVVYTTRDRDAELPAAVSYSVTTEGSYSVPAFEIEALAPEAFDFLLVNGVPLAELESLSTSAPIDLAWSFGDVDDYVYVELVGPTGSAVLCTFEDSEGVGTIPADALTETGHGRFGVHRVSARAFRDTDEVIATGELRFDYELTAGIDFVE